MKNLHNEYLNFVRSYANFYCVKTCHIKVITKSSNEFVARGGKKYCLKCFKQFIPLHEERNAIDIKYMYLKQKHVLRFDLNKSVSPDTIIQCDNARCVKNVKKIRDFDRCNECLKNVKSDEFLKKIINSISEFPNEMNFENFVKNNEIVCDDSYNIYSDYCYLYEKENIWSEIVFFQSVSSENESVQITNEFNPNKKSFIKHLLFFDENERKNLIFQSMEKFLTELISLE